jgi:hypothetical protein
MSKADPLQPKRSSLSWRRDSSTHITPAQPCRSLSRWLENGKLLQLPTLSGLLRQCHGNDCPQDNQTQNAQPSWTVIACALVHAVWDAVTCAYPCRRYVKTSDGTKRDFKPGDVLFQDNTKESPAAKVPMHESGVLGTVPCQQLIIQLLRAPEVDRPGQAL